MFKYADGKIYDGEWRDDVPHGKAKFTYEDGLTIHGEYENGKRVSNIQKESQNIKTNAQKNDTI